MFVSGLASKPMGMVCEWFGLKTTQTVFAGLASKLVAKVSGSLASKPTATVSSGLASKPAVMVSNGLTSKPVVTVSSGLASKPAATVFSSLVSKLVATVFSSLASKLVATVSWFGPQNHVGFGLSVAPQNRWRDVGVGHASRSTGLLHVEASLARVSQSGLKTSGDATTGGACGTITEVTSEAS
jgi:hypothetical protein